jgi:hypothetical protein
MTWRGSEGNRLPSNRPCHESDNLLDRRAVDGGLGRPGDWLTGGWISVRGWFTDFSRIHPVLVYGAGDLRLYHESR